MGHIKIMASHVFQISNAASWQRMTGRWRKVQISTRLMSSNPSACRARHTRLHCTWSWLSVDEGRIGDHICLVLWLRYFFWFKRCRWNATEMYLSLQYSYSEWCMNQCFSLLPSDNAAGDVFVDNMIVFNSCGMCKIVEQCILIIAEPGLSVLE